MAIYYLTLMLNKLLCVCVCVGFLINIFHFARVFDPSGEISFSRGLKIAKDRNVASIISNSSNKALRVRRACRARERILTKCNNCIYGPKTHTHIEVEHSHSYQTTGDNTPFNVSNFKGGCRSRVPSS